MVGIRIEVTVTPGEKTMQRRVTHPNLDSLTFEANAIVKREVGSKIGVIWFLPDPGYVESRWKAKKQDQLLCPLVLLSASTFPDPRPQLCY